MTTAEKAGQLTQFFYFDLPPAGEAADQASGGAAAPRPSIPGQGITVDEALARGQVGSLLFVADPAEINRLQQLAVEETRLTSPCSSASTSFTASVRSSRADRPGRLLGSRRRSNEPRASPPARPAQSASTGLLRRWSTSPATPAGAGSWKEPAKILSWVPRGAPRCAAFRARDSAPRPIRRAEAFRRLRRGAGGRDYDASTSPTRSSGTSTCPRSTRPSRRAPARHERLHGPERRARDRQPLAADRRPARHLGFEGFVVSDANAVRSLQPWLRGRLADAGARAVRAGVDMEMAIGNPAYAHLPEAIGRPGRRGGAGRLVRRVLTPRSGSACSTSRTSTRTTPGGTGRSGPPRGSAEGRPSAVPSCSATRAACCRWPARPPSR